MNQLVFIENNRPLTDSLRMAESFNKDHKNVLADIENQLSKLSEAGMSDWGLLNFQHTQYQHQQNKQWYPKFNMTEDGFALVAMSYVTPQAMKMKISFLEEFKRLKEELYQNQFNLPQTMIEAVESYLLEMKKNALLESVNQQLEIENTEQKQQLKEQEAPVAIYKLAIAAQNTQSMADVAKALGTGRNRLFDILRDEKIIPLGRTVPYQRYIESGYFVVRERPRASGDTIVNDPVPRVTAKGFDYIARLLQKRQGA